MRRSVLTLLPLLAAPATAQPTAPDTTLPEVSVVATRIAIEAHLAPSRVVTIDSDDARAAGAESVADILDWRAPVQVRRYGPGGIATLSIRGSTASQTAVLIDGHAITDPQLGMVDLALLPALLAERVEVLHGAGSALHGAGAMGGAVSVTTPSASSESTIAARSGAWSEWGVDALGAVRAGRVGMIVSATGTAARDDYPYFDPNAGVSGSVVRRTGADRALGSFLGRVEVNGSARIGAGLWLAIAERGAPGSAGTAPDQGGRQHDRLARAWSSISGAVGPSQATLAGALQYSELRYVGNSSDDHGRTIVASATTEWTTPLVGWTTLVGLEAAAAAAHHPALPSRTREGRASTWVAASGRLGPLRLFPAIRGDAYMRPAAGALIALSPRLGASLESGSFVTFKGSAGSAFRPPTFNDRFWRYAGQAEAAGDPDLRPERGWTADVGLHLQRWTLTAEATVYYSSTRDQIVWLPSESGLFVPQNLTSTIARGTELTARAQDIEAGRTRLSAGLGYVLTDARDRSMVGSPAYDRQLRYVARHAVSAHASATADVGPVDLRLDVQGRVLGSRPTRADGGAPLPAHAVADARLTIARQVARMRFEATVSVENVTDSRYSVMDGYPMPPRHASLTLRLTP